MMKNRRRNGFILLSVMLMATTLLTAATAFAWFARTEAKAETTRERIFRFRSVAEIAANIATRRITEDTNEWDGYTESLYAPDQFLEIELGDYTAKVYITPLNNKIPINEILLPDGTTVRSEYESAWTTIWQQLEQPEMAYQVIDFIDTDTEQSPGGVERASNINRKLSDLTELRTMENMTDAILWGETEDPDDDFLGGSIFDDESEDAEVKTIGLADYVSVIGDEKININVAEPEVIAVLDPALTLSHANNIVAYRESNPLTVADDLYNVPGFPAELVTKLANIIAFKSTYFGLDIEVSDTSENKRNYKVVVQRGAKGYYRWEE